MATSSSTTTRRIGTALAVGGLSLTTVLVDGPAAEAAPARSSRTLPALAQPASAVDPAGGSLVLGDTAAGELRAYARNADGTWRSSVLVQAARQGAVLDTAAVSVRSGGYVLAWLRVDPVGADNVAYVARRDPDGRVSAPVRAFSTEARRIRLAANADGDAALVDAAGTTVARLRGTAAPVVQPLVAEPGEPGERKRGVVVGVTRSGSIDVTYAYGPAASDAVVQQTLGTTGAPVRRVLRTDDQPAAVTFGIARPSDNRAVLAVNNRAGAVTVFQEETPRGPFDVAWSEGGTNLYAPHVAARGRFARVTYRLVSESVPGQHSRRYDGQRWTDDTNLEGAPSYGGDNEVDTPLAIGLDGRGVDVTWGRTDGDGIGGESDWVYRAFAEAGDFGSGQGEVSSLDARAVAHDVGESSVSQTVITEDYLRDGQVAQRTRVLVRR